MLLYYCLPEISDIMFCLLIFINQVSMHFVKISIEAGQERISL